MSDFYENNAANGCMDWDDVIESDGQEFVILEEGDYIFTVTGFERGRFPGGPKVPACNKAALTLQVKTDEGIATVRTDLLLYRSLEWRLSSFFRCIGQASPERRSSVRHVGRMPKDRAMEAIRRPSSPRLGKRTPM